MYYLLIPYIVIFYCYFLSNGKVNRSFFAFLFASIWIYVFAMRGDGYGLDIRIYYNIFIDSSYYELDEPFLGLFNSAISMISTEQAWFSLCYAMLLNSLVVSFYKIASPKHYVSIFILLTCTFVFYQINLNIYRQALAVIFSLIFIYLSFRYGHYLFIGVVLALFIHKAAIFSIILYFFCFIKPRRIYFFIALLMCFLPIGSMVVTLVFEYSTTFFPVLKGSLYEYQRVQNVGLVGSSDFDHRTLPIIFSLFVCLFFYDDVIEKNRISLSVLLFSIFCASIFKDNVLVFDRIALYAQLVTPLFFVLCLERLNRVRAHMLWFSLAASSAIFTLFIWGPRNFLGLYRFIF